MNLMKTRNGIFKWLSILNVTSLLMLAAGSAPAAVRYVNVNSSNPSPPYLTWGTAATNIQDAIDVTLPYDEVVVTNGVYRSGGTVGGPNNETNGVVVPGLVKLRSVNGPGVTIIDGLGAMRCVYLNDSARLAGFTLMNGVATAELGGGGGVNCPSTQTVVFNCVFTGNSASVGGAGWGGTLNNCKFTGNSAAFGGGAAFCTLNNCTLTDNSAGMGGGAYACTLTNCTISGNSGTSSFGSGGAIFSILNNCIVYFNSAPNVPNYYGCVMNYCCTTPQATTNGIGNFSSAPLFVNLAGRNLRLQSNSPCINAGNNDYVIIGTDLDGNPRISGGTVDVGAYEFVLTLGPVVRYVNVNNTTPSPPYTNWASAATNIQDAVDAALTGEEIVVTNGIYRSGGKVGGPDSGTNSNRVAVTKPLTLRSVNGAEATIIDGLSVVRCVYLADGATLAGFTLTGGTNIYGGGVYGESTDANVSNCVLTGNSAGWGGGAWSGTLTNCTLTNNSAYVGGGARGSTLNNCTLTGNYASIGGGTDHGTLNNCTLTGNWTSSPQPFGESGNGGGAEDSTLVNCALISNSATNLGGGAFGGTLINCTLTGNSAANIGGGTRYSSLFNCINYFNRAPQEPNYSFGTLNHCCTTPMPTNGVGNFTNSPLFLDFAGGNLRLQSESPCIDAGNNDYVTTDTDLDGNPRISNDIVDVGAYEFVFRSGPVTLYVNVNNATPKSPYITWATAATNIQDAVDVGLAGDEILVTNGVYRSGDRVVDFITNRVVLTKSLTLRSVNGAGVTIIDGLRAVRCVYLTHGAALVGFTLTNGVAFHAGYGGGGGVRCESTNAVVSDCVLVTNAAYDGAGAFGGTLNKCTLVDNGAFEGGGAEGSILNNCILARNGAADVGGGADSSTLNNCTLVDNDAGYQGGGARNCTLNNCILYFNIAQDSPNYAFSTLNYCCTTPIPTDGVGNFTNSPLFVDLAGGNLRLESDSPCIDAGNNNYVTTDTDLDGNPRISGGTVDVGAYEFVFTPDMEVGRLILMVENSNLGTKNLKPLLASLEAALASFERRNLISGVNQLKAFQSKVEAQVARIDSALAGELVDRAQRIIDEVQRK
jgi:hypothetical protein